jgi:predicted TIM-barrel fold metal-dependent hydrolase
MLNDAHCHFFSTEFFDTLARQRGADPSGAQLCADLGWDPPGTAWTLADRWVQELDANGVGRAAIIASVPGDETSVAAAVGRHPDRFVGFFMLDPASPDAVNRTKRAVTELGLRGVCLFPAMHHVSLEDERLQAVVDAAAQTPGTAVFVHCGMLSIGVRKKLGLPSRFALKLGDPLGVAKLASAFPSVPFIIPHFGAGMLREALMAADACPNVHLDTSSSNGWIRYTPGLTLEAVFAAALAVAGPARLLFGTDSSFFPRGWQKPIAERQRTVLTGIEALSDDERALIFGGNFDRLFPSR